jgi:hypothetical protein
MVTVVMPPVPGQPDPVDLWPSLQRLHGQAAPGIAQHVPDGDRDTTRFTVPDLDGARIHRGPVLGGLINEYMYAA